MFWFAGLLSLNYQERIPHPYEESTHSLAGILILERQIGQ